MALVKRIGREMQIFAPAKINLYLHIVGRRPDGFHELETLMVPISLGDDLRMACRDEPGILLECSDPTLTTGPDNLIHRAIILFQERYRWLSGVQVHVTKRIPIGAGLGGGSGNAAATLLGLRGLSGLEIPDAELADLAAQLGSDTAFFIQATPAVCRGRGEILEPMALTQSYAGLLINPGFGVSTPWAYQAYARNPRPGEPGRELSFGRLRNDLEPPVLGKYLWIATAKEWLRQQAGVIDALMSGSGSSLFAILRPETEAKLLASKFRAAFGQTVLALPIRINSGEAE